MPDSPFGTLASRRLTGAKDFPISRREWQFWLNESHVSVLRHR